MTACAQFLRLQAVMGQAEILSDILRARHGSHATDPPVLRRQAFSRRVFFHASGPIFLHARWQVLVVSLLRKTSGEVSEAIIKAVRI